MTPHEIACELVTDYRDRDLNEADTRHQVIDRILHEVLTWPHNAVNCEAYVDIGYLDYRLRKPNGQPLLIIEAKKEGKYFTLPASFSKDALARHIVVKTLVTDPAIKSAMTQVRDYCISDGCEFAAITNGHEWIFFKTFERGHNWLQLKAFAIRSLDYFAESFSEATNLFSYRALLDDASLTSLLSPSTAPLRDMFYPKEHITAYNEAVTNNRFAPRLRPLIERYFGVIDDTDPNFMDECYVNLREYDRAYKGVYALIRDSLTPYFRRHDVKEFRDDDSGGLFGRAIVRTLQRQRRNQVIVLFGGKGSGKSTFLRKLLNYSPPAYLSKHARIAIVDLLDRQENKDTLRREIFEQIISALDQDKLLHGTRDQILYLFSDRYELAKKQVLCGLDETGEAYNVRLNELLADWLQDREYCAAQLASYWNKRHKGLIVVIDNTDQYSRDLQDLCFSIARDVSGTLGSLVIISMREERYHSSKIQGILDAYSVEGFHIASPYPELVFQRRVDYVLKLLRSESTYIDLLGDINNGQLNEFRSFFKIFRKEFRETASPLNRFLAASAHGNIRAALDLFKGFMLSGYTNVDEMTSSRYWTIAVHQVVKPVMIPNRFFYDEEKSAIPNIFQVRSKRNGSHFTAFRLLRLLVEGEDKTNPPYVPVAQLREHFAYKFNMAEDFIRNLDMLLKGGFVEANNRIDEYCDAVDSVRITNYGLYLMEELAFYFAYLDLVCVDCAVFNENIANYLVTAANEDYRLFRRHLKLERVERRLEKTEEFLKYLISEEKREAEIYGLPSKEAQVSSDAMENFIGQRPRILRSAGKSRRP